MSVDYKQLDQMKILNKSLEDSATASDKNSRAMNFLTGALVLLTLAQFVIAYLNYNAEQQIIKVRKQCYQTVLQTSDIDMNYKSCLRDHGLSI
jgi:hypothetical protein